MSLQPIPPPLSCPPVCTEIPSRSKSDFYYELAKGIQIEREALNRIILAMHACEKSLPFDLVKKGYPKWYDTLDEQSVPEIFKLVREKYNQYSEAHKCQILGFLMLWKLSLALEKSYHKKISDAPWQKGSPGEDSIHLNDFISAYSSPRALSSDEKKNN